MAGKGFDRLDARPVAHDPEGGGAPGWGGSEVVGGDE